MKDFKVQLNNPPQGVYFPGMMVTGMVTAETDVPKDYKQIKVQLVGRADVHWSESRGSGNDRRTVHYTSDEQYLDCFAVLWDKDNAGGIAFPVGIYHFNFSLQLAAPKLPASYQGIYGQIRYTVEARVVKEGLLKRDTTAKAVIPLVNTVTINSPQLMSPVSMEVQKTLCCWCCASGPIVMNARIPRTGFCIKYDSIPIEVSVENGSSREIRHVTASIHKQVIYTAEGSERQDSDNITTIGSEPITPHNSIVWRPNPLTIPETSPTLTSCAIIQVNYFLRVTAAISWAINPHINIPITLGNVPLSGQLQSAPHVLQSNPPPQSTAPMPYPPQPLEPYPPPYEPPSGFSNQLPIGFVDPIKKS